VVATTLIGLRRDGAPEAAALLKLGLLLGAALVLGFWVGFVAAMAAFLAAFWLGVHRMRPVRAIPLALGFGVAMPAAFALAVDSPLWRGIVAPLLPGLVGGDVAPPL
jgi:4-hydroxybenzoate polyprenyltransferase